MSYLIMRICIQMAPFPYLVVFGTASISSSVKCPSPPKKNPAVKQLYGINKSAKQNNILETIQLSALFSSWHVLNVIFALCLLFLLVSSATA